MSADGCPLVLLVGHCGFDSGGLTAAVGSALPGVKVERVNTQVELDARRGKGVILLVNRVLDGSFHAADGVELIRAEAARGDVRPLLISDLADSQTRAQEAGGLTGFGKRDVGTPTATERIRAAAEPGAGPR